MCAVQPILTSEASEQICSYISNPDHVMSPLLLTEFALAPHRRSYHIQNSALCV